MDMIRMSEYGASVERIEAKLTSSHARACVIDIHFNFMESRPNGMIYASLKDASTDETIISADLNYILRTSKERNYKIVNLQSQLEYLCKDYTVKARG